MPLDQITIDTNGLRPRLLGMTPTQIEKMLGEQPRLERRKNKSEEVFRFDKSHCRIVASEGCVVEVAFWPPARVMIGNRSLFEEPSIWREIAAADGNPLEVAGFVVLCNLGLTLTGFYDNDPTQLSITTFERCRWDGLAQEMTPLIHY